MSASVTQETSGFKYTKSRSGVEENQEIICLQVRGEDRAPSISFSLTGEHCQFNNTC